MAITIAPRAFVKMPNPIVVLLGPGAKDLDFLFFPKAQTKRATARTPAVPPAISLTGSSSVRLYGIGRTSLRILIASLV